MEHGTEVQQGNTSPVADFENFGKARNFCFTSYRGRILKKENVKYLLQGDEVCPQTGRQHIQGFIIFKNPRVISGVIKEYKDIHWEYCKGNIEQNIEYCKKSGIFTEDGEVPAGQGARTDVKSITKLISEGKSDNEILTEHEDNALRMYKGIGWARAKMKTSEKRNWPMEVRIYWGNAGSNKTRTVYDEFGIDNVYKKPVGRWWDNYCGEKVILIDDFDPEDMHNITYQYYLELLDRYPMQVEIKGGYVNFCSKIIIFTSNHDPKEWFKDKTNRKAWERRITEIRHFEGGIEEEIGSSNSTTPDTPSSYPPPSFLHIKW